MKIIYKIILQLLNNAPNNRYNSNGHKPFELLFKNVFDFNLEWFSTNYDQKLNIYSQISFISHNGLITFVNFRTKFKIIQRVIINDKGLEKGHHYNKHQFELFITDNQLKLTNNYEQYLFEIL